MTKNELQIILENFYKYDIITNLVIKDCVLESLIIVAEEEDDDDDDDENLNRSDKICIKK